MFAYVIRRLLISIVVLFFATILVFILVASSGNPLAVLLENPHISHETILHREEILHLNDPLWQRYWIWLTGVLHGNLGHDHPRPGRGLAGHVAPAGDAAHGGHRHAHRHLRRHLPGCHGRSPPEQAHRQDDHGDQLHPAGHAGVRPRSGPQGVRGHPDQRAPEHDHLLYERRTEPDAERDRSSAGCPTTPRTRRCPSSPSSWSPTRRGPSISAPP